MFRNRSVDVHRFAMVPRAEIPRASFRMEHTHKTTFDAGYLVPVFCEEILPGDTMRCKMTAFCRMSTPIFPIMDNLYLDSFFFFVPNRLVWTNWVKFMGEQDNPADSTSYTVPLCISPSTGWAIGSLGDYFGLGTVGQVVGAGSTGTQALPLRAYNLIWNKWFRDENLQNSVTERRGDSGDVPGDYNLLRRGKRHDYFTSALPWPQKGASVSLPLGTEAPVVVASETSGTVSWRNATTGAAVTTGALSAAAGGTTAGATAVYLDPSNSLVTDLSAATAATINQLRQAFQIQKLLERDARGGSRYTEIIRAHFGVMSPDARLQRPEYLGGGSTPVSIHPVAQTSATGVSGGTSPQGNLSAIATALAMGHGFSQSFTEHGYIIGLVSVRADLTYQQGIRRHWLKSTKYDFYWPAFAMLGEQSIYNVEIYCQGSGGAAPPLSDGDVFGYQERWAEYRYHPSRISGLFRSTASGTLDAWHLAQDFSSVPTLSDAFIQDTPPLERVLAAGATEPNFIGDFMFSCHAARPMPMYSVPGLIDHF